jgi:hypothetical protein
MASRMDDDISTYNYDVDLDKYMKESWCKRFSLQHPRMKKYKKYPNVLPSYQEVELKDEPYSADALAILQAAASLGKLIQLNTPGFLSNLRQHRTSGLVMIDLAQTARRYWAAVRAGKPFAFSTQSSSTQNGKPHPFGWRDFMDISVRWRQYSEPNDPVFWIDLLAPEAFAEGFGLQTPMVTGQMNVVRYFPYCAKAIDLLKQLVPTQGVCDVRDRTFFLPSDRLERLASVKTCDELFQVIGQGFYLETPCASIGIPGTSFSGTRITLLQKPPGGYEFTIRTPGTPARWQLYAKEFDLLWERMTKAATAQVVDQKELSTCIFAFYFYWCNFGPLSRGTAATGPCATTAATRAHHCLIMPLGFMALVGLFLGAGLLITTPVPKDKQVRAPSRVPSHVSKFLRVRAQLDVVGRLGSHFKAECQRIPRICGPLVRQATVSTQAQHSMRIMR